MSAVHQFIKGVPKCELHLHIEGTFEPELMFKIAERNGLKVKYKSVEEAHKAYDFSDLQSFLDLYYDACGVLLKEQDFFDLCYEYLKRASEDNVKYAEIFFDPQTHTERKVPMETVINGLYRATLEAEKELGIRSKLILCFLRHLSGEAAEQTLRDALPFKDKFIAVGLDSGEDGNPPEKFAAAYKLALESGLQAVAHAGEEGDPSYITGALALGVRRIDHGVRCLEDPAVVDRLVKEGIPLTVCPNSNHRLKVVDRYFKGQSPIRLLLDKGLRVTLNSDDPAYFGGYMNDNFIRAADDCNLTIEEIFQICKTSFESTMLSENEQKAYLEQLIQYREQFEA